MEEIRNKYRCLIGRPEGKISTGSLRCTRKNTFKIEFKETGKAGAE
jgi:hypothetical protein